MRVLILICGARNIGRLTVDRAIQAGHEVEEREHLYKAKGDFIYADSDY